ncbi:MAG: dUTP diphosphatase [Actinobacteria bacterium]|nr:dUTP diphosphatase [Actinomycetota bacterium]
MTNPQLTTELCRQLVELWTEVANAGGAVGLVAPTTVEEVEAVASAAFDRVRAGRDDLVLALDGEQPVGLGFLERNDTRLQRHVGVIRRLQRAPSHTGRRIGAALLLGLEDVARRHGLLLLTLVVRGGTGREHFYLARGYRLDARLPDRLRLADGQLIDELRLSKSLGGHGPRLPIQRLDDELPLPRYAHPGDAGLDLHARERVALQPGDRAVVPTGVAVAIPDGCVGLVHPRSGLAARHGLTLVNAPGTIDAGYRGEIKVILANTDLRQPVVLQRGDRIAQLVIQRVETVAVIAVDQLPTSARGDGGFGSTGS